MDKPTIEAVATWLERLAAQEERMNRADLGGLFADTRAEAWRAAAHILRTHPEVLNTDGPAGHQESP